jgi:hypothetical protein
MSPGSISCLYRSQPPDIQRSRPSGSSDPGIRPPESISPGSISCLYRSQHPGYQEPRGLQTPGIQGSGPLDHHLRCWYWWWYTGIRGYARLDKQDEVRGLQNGSKTGHFRGQIGHSEGSPGYPPTRGPSPPGDVSSIQAIPLLRSLNEAGCNRWDPEVSRGLQKGPKGVQNRSF